MWFAEEAKPAKISYGQFIKGQVMCAKRMRLNLFLES